MSLEEINGVDDFVQRLNKLETPNQMISVLDDSLLQKYLALTDDEKSQRRIDNWLSLFLDSQLQAEDDWEESNRAFREVLEKILSFARYTKVSSLQHLKDSTDGHRHCQTQLWFSSLYT